MLVTAKNVNKCVRHRCGRRIGGGPTPIFKLNVSAKSMLYSASRRTMATVNFCLSEAIRQAFSETFDGQN